MSLDSPAELTTDAVVTALSKNAAGGDDGLANISLGDMRAAIEAELSKAREAVARLAAESGGNDEPEPELPTLPAKPLAEVMGRVREPSGAFNWSLCRADGAMEVTGYGNASVEQMRRYLLDADVLCGLLRLTFKVSGRRLQKWSAF
jgi:hypothetical protein